MAEPRRETVPERAVLTDAMEHANLPSLVAVLYQLTGDRRYLADPYRPTRSRGMEDNDPGGFAPEIQAEIRAAAVDAVLAWAAGRPPAIPAPTGDALLELIDLAVGEPVPPEYGPMTAEDMGFDVPDAPTAPRSDFRVVVIGAGVSGMLAAIRLAEAGIDHVVLEKNADVGGTWLENAYPGAGVDTPSHLYSYSFAPRRWSTHFGKRDEVLTYLRDVADDHDLRKVIRFDTEVASAVYGEQRWTVTTTEGETLTADAVITAVGQLNRPKIPALPGMDAFRGPLFHSARWPADLDVTGKRVAVVGTGASAMQIVPAIAERAAHVTVFQRSPQWAAPNEVYFAPIDDAASLLMEHVPFYRRWYRTRLSWNTGDRVHTALQKDPEWEHRDRSVNAVNDGHRRVLHPAIWRPSWRGGPTSSRRRCRTTRRSASGCCWTTAGTRRSAGTTSSWSPRRSCASRRPACGRATAPRSRRTSSCCARGSRRRSCCGQWRCAGGTGARSPTPGVPTTPTPTLASP